MVLRDTTGTNKGRNDQSIRHTESYLTIFMTGNHIELNIHESTGIYFSITFLAYFI